MKKAREDKKELAYGTLQFVFQSKSKCIQIFMLLVFELSMPVNKMKFNVNRTKAAKEKNRRLIFRLFRLYLFTLALLFSMLLLSHRANNTHTHTNFRSFVLLKSLLCVAFTIHFYATVYGLHLFFFIFHHNSIQLYTCLLLNAAPVFVPCFILCFFLSRLVSFKFVGIFPLVIFLLHPYFIHCYSPN